MFFLCFSVVNPSSLESIKTKWLPETQKYCPNALKLVVGLKTDLRNNVDTVRALLERKVSACATEGSIFAA